MTTGMREPGGDQMSHEVEAAHSGHPHIEHHTADTISTGRLQEGSAEIERLDGKSSGHQEIPEGATQRRVVVTMQTTRSSCAHVMMPVSVSVQSRVRQC